MRVSFVPESKMKLSGAGIDTEKICFPLAMTGQIG
jgi:hypothetical protein